MQSPSVPERFRPLFDATVELAERFNGAGRTLYLVGGSVRDALFSQDVAKHDLDLTTDARPDEIEKLVRGLGRGRLDPRGSLWDRRRSARWT